MKLCRMRKQSIDASAESSKVSDVRLVKHGKNFTDNDARKNLHNGYTNRYPEMRKKEQVGNKQTTKRKV